LTKCIEVLHTYVRWAALSRALGGFVFNHVIASLSTYGASNTAECCDALASRGGGSHARVRAG
jgi:hypothetical protein